MAERKKKKIYIRKNFSWEASSLDPVIYLSFLERLNRKLRFSCGTKMTAIYFGSLSCIHKTCIEIAYRFKDDEYIWLQCHPTS